MRTRNTKSILSITFTFLLTILFCSTAFAAITGTDSKGSYSYDESKKEEGSKSKTPPAQGTQGSVTKKGEGSGSKAYPLKKHQGKMHGKKEGSGSKAYPHKSPKGYMHGKKEGSGQKSYMPSRRGYMHKSKEGSGSKKYSHGSSHGTSYSSHKSSGYSRSHRSGKSPFGHVLHFTKKLGLTNEQVDKIKAHEFEFKKMKIQTTADNVIAHMELDRLVHSATIDEAGMRALADRISEIKSIKIHAMIEAKIVLLKVLTPEQRQKVSQMHSSK